MSRERTVLYVVWLPLLLQLSVVVGLLGWLAVGQPASRTGWLLRALLVATYLAATALGGLWLVLPWYTPLIYTALFGLSVARSFRRWHTLPDLPPTPRTRNGTIAVGAVLAFALAVTGYLQSGRHPPTDAVELAFPLRGGPYLILNGGGNELLNAHLATLQGKRFRPWRGQSYGVDIVKLDSRGLRARGILPADPSRYAIFGELLYSPCSGAVVAAVDGVQDMLPPRTDRRHMAGNHVILDCGGNVWVLLGHLQRGSVLVHQGDGMITGQALGRVGNTGNSNEPHLHIHAQRPGTAEAPLSGDPLPIRFGDRYPVRNALFAQQPATPRGTGLSVLP